MNTSEAGMKSPVDCEAGTGERRRCERCGFDLSAVHRRGEQAAAVRCPECGTLEPGEHEWGERGRLRRLGVMMLVWGLPAWAAAACVSVFAGKGWWRQGTPWTRSEVVTGQFGFSAGRAALGLLPAMVVVAGVVCLMMARPRLGWARRVCWVMVVGAALAAGLQFAQAATDSLTTGLQGLNSGRRRWFFDGVSWAALVLSPAMLGLMMREIGEVFASRTLGAVGVTDDAGAKTARLCRRAGVILMLAVLVVDASASLVLSMARVPVNSVGWTPARIAPAVAAGPQPLTLYEVGVWLSVLKYVVAAGAVGVGWAAACVLGVRMRGGVWR